MFVKLKRLKLCTLAIIFCVLRFLMWHHTHITQSCPRCWMWYNCWLRGKRELSPTGWQWFVEVGGSRWVKSFAKKELITCKPWVWHKLEREAVCLQSKRCILGNELAATLTLNPNFLHFPSVPLCAVSNSPYSRHSIFPAVHILCCWTLSEVCSSQVCPEPTLRVSSTPKQEGGPRPGWAASVHTYSAVNPAPSSSSSSVSLPLKKECSDRNFSFSFLTCQYVITWLRPPVHLLFVLLMLMGAAEDCGALAHPHHAESLDELQWQQAW